MTTAVDERSNALPAALLPRIVRTPLEPIIRRHVSDAAFYWTQADATGHASHLTASRSEHFAEMLEGHLEGLEVAGGAAVPLSQEALQRWRKPGEAFVAMYTALALPPGSQQVQAINDVVQVVAGTPDLLLRGAISALAWRDTATVQEWIQTAATSHDTVSQVAALRAAALHGWELERWQASLHQDSPFVRAAACRSAPVQALAALQGLSSDTDRVVRAEATLARARLVPQAERAAEQTAQLAGQLWRCVVEQVQLAATATGWNRMQAQRRLDRWLRHLAWLAPSGGPGVPELLRRLPPRMSLSFVLHHGDPALLPFVVQSMHDEQQARWAGWVWRCLTGVCLKEAGLTQPDPRTDLDAPLTQAQFDADQGLPRPDAAAVADHPASALRLAPGMRLLAGQAVSPPALRALLDPDADQPQALRAVAAHALAQLSEADALNLRASPETQASTLARMDLRATKD
jgi:hypothetical protein